MSGTEMGRIKAKLGLKGKQPPGAMIARMNEMKTGGVKQYVKTGTSKVVNTIKKII